MRQAMSSWRERISRHTSTPLPSGSLDVEHRHLGTGRRDAGERLLGRARLADDLDVALGLEQVADPTPNDLVIVEKDTRIGIAPILSSRRGRS
jgi:hypothetical protein